MGVKVREKVKGSGEYWIFIDYKGQRKSKKIGNLKTAEAVAEKLKAKITLGEFNIKTDDAKPTFGKMANRWMESYNAWKDSTRETYRFALDKHVIPELGEIPVDRITRKTIRTFIDKKTKASASEYVKLMKVCISGTLKFAADEGLIEADPSTGISMKKKRSNLKVNPLSEDEVDLVLKEAQIFMDGYYYPAILFMIRTGVRIGEAQALKWTRIDLKKRTAYIDKAFRVNTISSPKSHQKRIIDLTPHLAGTLSGMKRGKFVFEGANGGMMHRETFRNALNRCVKKAGLKPRRIHDLRHTYATIRLMRKHNPWDVSRQLGHSSIKITYDIYGHWIPSQFKAEVDDLDRTPSITAD